MKRTWIGLIVLAALSIAQWSGKTVIVNGTGSVTGVRQGTYLVLSEDPLVDTGTVGLDTGGVKTWLANDSIVFLVVRATRIRGDSIIGTAVQATRGRFGTIYGAALSGNFIGDATDSMGNVLVVEAQRFRGGGAAITGVNADKLHGKDTNDLWNAKTLQGKDTTALARVDGNNTFTGSNVFRHISTNETTYVTTGGHFVLPYRFTAFYDSATVAAETVDISLYDNSGEHLGAMNLAGSTIPVVIYDGLTKVTTLNGTGNLVEMRYTPLGWRVWGSH